MPTIEALSAGIGVASPSTGIGGGVEFSSGLSGGHFSTGSIDFNNFAGFESLNFPSPDTSERSEIFNLDNYQVTATGKPDSFTQTPTIGEDYSLSRADQAQLKEVESSFADAGLRLHETQEIIQEAAIAANNQSLIRHLDFAYRPLDVKPGEVESEQFTEVILIEDSSPVELMPVIRPARVMENKLPSVLVPPHPIKMPDPRGYDQITELEPQRKLDPTKVALQTEHGEEVAKEVIIPLLAGLDIYSVPNIEIVKDEEAAGNRVHGIKKGVEAKDKNTPITGPELVNALTTNTGRIEGKLRSSGGVDGSLVETVAQLLQLKPEKPADLEQKALGIVEHNPPGEVSTTGKRLSIKEIDSIVIARTASSLTVFLRKLLKV